MLHQLASPRLHAVLAALLCVVFADSGPAGAICDVIPGVDQDQRSVLGSVNRPYASPGDVVGIEVNPAICDDASPGLAAAAGDHVVTLLFTPPALSGGPASAVLLAEDCTGLEAACDAGLPGTGRVACLVANQPGVPADLFLRTDPTGRRQLFFRFPDTDTLFSGADDERTLSGPVRIVVTRAGDTLSCDLAASNCQSAPAGSMACVDELFGLDGTCNTAPEDRGATFGHFTALPHPNRYDRVCTPTPGSPCTGDAPELRFTTDLDGNVLIPWNYNEVLVREDGVPVARLGLGAVTAAVEAFAGGAALQIPRKGFLSSHAQNGLRVPPIFTPLTDSDTTLFGTIDAPRGVMRVARRNFLQCHGGPSPGSPCAAHADCTPGTCGVALCSGGGNDGLACGDDAGCPGGACGPSLFEFRDRYAESGTGPVLVSTGDYAAEAGDPVPLDGLQASDDLFAFIRSERIGPEDINQDGDTLDYVVTLKDRDTGTGQNIGFGGSEGRAVSRFAIAPFTFPAVASDGEFLAFLESEPSEGNTPGNADNDEFDFIVRAFRLGDPVELISQDVPGTSPVALSAPLTGHQPLKLSAGRLFFLSPEAMGTSFTQKRISAGVANVGDVHFSANGRHIAYKAESARILVHDRDSDGNGIFDEAGGTATVLASKDPSGAQAGGQQEDPTLSADGRFVAWSGNVATVVPPGNGGNIFVHDRDLDEDGIFDETGAGEFTTVVVSVDDAGNFPPGVQCNGITRGAYRPGLSADGRFVVFYSGQIGLDPADTNAACVAGLGQAGVRGIDVFLHDRDTDTDGIYDELGAISTRRISLRTDGAESPQGIHRTSGFAQDSLNRFLSDDGRYVAFIADAALDPDEALLPEGADGVEDVYLADTVTGQVWWVSRSDAALPPDSSVRDASFNDLTPDGRYVAFSTQRNSIVPDDVNGTRDVFVWDRLTGRVTMESRSFSGALGNGFARFGSLSPDGRAIRFESASSNLVEGDDDPVFDSFLRLRLGEPSAVFRVKAPPEEIPLGNIPNPRRSMANSLVDEASVTAAVLPGDVGDTNADTDVFLTAVDPSDPFNAPQDRNADGDFGDIILRVARLDLAGAPVEDLGPSSRADIADGEVAFLRPEQAGEIGTDNGDGDLDDLVVHLWDAGGPAQRLGAGLAATDVLLSADAVAALVSEEAQGGASLNADADADDQVPHVYDRTGGTWTNLGVAADAIALEATRVAYTAPEADESVPPGVADANADGDDADRMMRLYDLTAGTDVPILDGSGRRQPAEDFVLGERLLAFRTRERAFCAGVDELSCSGIASCGGNACDLNSDGDCCDDVLQVYDTVGAQLLNSGSSVVPCQLEACDPRVPYRVGKDTVRFLTSELQEGRPLNGDGDALDLLVQVFSVRGTEADVEVVGQVAEVPPAQELEGTSIDPVEKPALDEPDRDSQIFLSQGVCVEDLGTVCGGPNDCDPGQACDAGTGTCRRDGDTCRVGIPDDCTPAETCVESPDNLIVVSAPDTDGDEVVDSLDNCPDDANTDQADADLDGLGDVCDAQTCGNGAIEPGEECDDGNLDDPDGCTRYCRVGGCFGDIDLDGEVDAQDADLFFDPNVAGCFPCAGPGCNPLCDSDANDQVNNPDALALNDALGTSCPPPSAGGSGATPGGGCGLGFELAFVMAGLGAWARRRGRPQPTRTP